MDPLQSLARLRERDGRIESQRQPPLAPVQTVFDALALGAGRGDFQEESVAVVESIKLAEALRLADFQCRKSHVCALELRGTLIEKITRGIFEGAIPT